eukprot:CAMPEP_0114286232 /NCGR_PEP_ID=MMETSP0059-20121206/5643_1 /TAXON_ID=36894 /ORGANISM="Pyramimonas parkeae, Strain CCMP726" /LENGTH=307 /DNA_ID=CAMNT_0001407249 /DNA_START=17 /DNA_END=940 /DNA_ORIENTATION=-
MTQVDPTYDRAGLVPGLPKRATISGMTPRPPTIYRIAQNHAALMAFAFPATYAMRGLDFAKGCGQGPEFGSLNTGEAARLWREDDGVAAVRVRPSDRIAFAHAPSTSGWQRFMAAHPRTREAREFARTRPLFEQQMLTRAAGGHPPSSLEVHATLHTSKPRRCSADSSAINSDSASLALPRRRASMPGTGACARDGAGAGTGARATRTSPSLPALQGGAVLGRHHCTLIPGGRAAPPARDAPREGLKVAMEAAQRGRRRVHQDLTEYRAGVVTLEHIKDRRKLKSFKTRQHEKALEAARLADSSNFW